MHEFTPQKVKICKHAWKKYNYLESLSHKTYITKFENCKELIQTHAFAWKPGL